MLLIAVSTQIETVMLCDEIVSFLLLSVTRLTGRPLETPGWGWMERPAAPPSAPGPQAS